MFFDFIYWRKVLRFAWAQKQWPGRNKMMWRLLVVVPLVSAIHALFFILDYLFFPRLWRQQVAAPVFIIGHARSGTTLMHRLMAADEGRYSFFLFWETMFPSLLEKKLIRALGVVDGWLGHPLLKRLQAWDEKTFAPFRHIHEQGLWIPEEDQFVMRSAFVTQQWALDLPLMHEVDIFHVDDMDAKHRRRWMRHYRACVKRQLLLHGGECTHLSKNPLMSGWVNALLEEFPDARFVVMMRDPVQCIPSNLKLVEQVYRAGGWTAEQYAASMAAMTNISFDTFHVPKQALQQHPDTPHVVVDYRRLTKEPKATTEQVYRALNLPLTPQFSDYLAVQQDRERGHSAKFEYSLGEFNLARSRIEAELAGFYEEWQWPREADVDR